MQRFQVFVELQLKLYKEGVFPKKVPQGTIAHTITQYGQFRNYCMCLDWGKKLGNPEETPEALGENGKSMHTRWRQESNPVLMF